jgi:ketosteroid isomerase-like protein
MWGVDGATLARLLDVEAIKQLKARYLRNVDAQSWDELRELFTDDARIEFEFPQMSFSDPEAFVAASIAGLAGARTVHHGHAPEIELIGGDAARGVWAMDDLVERPRADGPSWHGYGHYHEEYRRGEDGWRIASLRLTRLRVDEFDGSA